MVRFAQAEMNINLCVFVFTGNVRARRDVGVDVGDEARLEGHGRGGLGDALLDGVFVVVEAGHGRGGLQWLNDLGFGDALNFGTELV